MTSMTDPQLVTAAEAARLLGVSRQRVLELTAASSDFPPAEHTATGGRLWSRVPVQAWAATHPDPGPVFTGPDLPPDSGHPPQIWAVLSHAANEAHKLNHPWIGDEHLVLGAHTSPNCPGAAVGAGFLRIHPTVRKRSSSAWRPLEPRHPQPRSTATQLG